MNETTPDNAPPLRGMHAAVLSLQKRQLEMLLSGEGSLST